MEIDDVLNDISVAYAKATSPVNNHCVNGQCSKCGDCCSNFLPLSAKEVVVIHKAVKQRGLKEHFRPMLAHADQFCPFFTGNSCEIYDIRPQICKSFKCDYQDRQSMEEFKWCLDAPRDLVDMREEFFNGKS